MRPLRYALLLLLTALVMPGSSALAALSDYVFATGTGSTITPSSYTVLWNGNYTGRSSPPGPRSSFSGQSALVDLPFTFYFNGVGYTQIRIGSHGLIGLGSGAINTSYSNSMPSAASNGPVITGLWDRFYISGPASSYCGFTSRIRYGTAGTAPRIFVIDYDDISVGYGEGTQYGPQYQDWQVRLYEGTNVIEFFYSNVAGAIPTCLTNWGFRSLSTSSSIGLAASTSDYMSITPTGGSAASMSRTSFNNNVNTGNTNGTAIGANTIYTFTPCNLEFVPNIPQGGATNMASGATLMSNISLERGESQSYQPFTLALIGSGCIARNLTIILSGTHAGDYRVSPIGSQFLAPGGTLPINVTFTPQSIGPRTATLTISDQFGATRIYTLRATALPRISWTPNLAQGGTPSLASGDTLLKDYAVRRRQLQDLSPFTLRNFSANGAIPPAPVTYTIDSAGRPSAQYRLLTPSTVSLGPGQSHTPVIRFEGMGLGPQNARLTVNADGEVRVFQLRAISGAPGIEIANAGFPVDPANPLFHQAVSCVGDAAATIPLTLSNPGQFELVVTSIEFYRTDTTDRQGAPPFPLIRDAQGRVVRMTDYILSDAPGVVPMADNTPAVLPFTLPAGESRTIHATLVGEMPGRRFGRAFIRTNAENVYGTDTTLNGATNDEMGLLTFDLVGRSVGGRLAANSLGEKLKTIVFAHSKVGEPTFMSFTIANTGACDLRINRNKLRISSGDVNEFRLMSSLPNATLDATTGDYIIAAGQTDTLVVRFTPSRAGTRLARLWIQTNDSTISAPGLAERGAYYLDLTGRGLAGLEARELVLDPVVIGSSVSGEAVVENTQTVPVEVGSMSFVGDDAAEFAESNWPARPFKVMPGEKMSLGVMLTPTGLPGIRRTTLMLVTTTNDTVRIPVRGEAGVQALVVSPTTLFDAVTIPSGQTRRQTVKISNDGTLPVRITKVEITGADKDSYVLGRMPRLDLEAGQTEYLEVTYAPTMPGQTSAELVFTASNGQTYTVLLGGTALKSRVDPNDPTTTTLPGDDAPTVRSRRSGDAIEGASDDRPTLR